jgi:hypothetical protein
MDTSQGHCAEEKRKKALKGYKLYDFTYACSPNNKNNSNREKISSEQV